ncbi:uncharacterized protein [Drosophila tropicalis]|uniref:uncharacterized protein isoform X2 n=1 Tax=Drosophila tropicalis TaxID=46794 RepID=UPI0035AB77F0
MNESRLSKVDANCFFEIFTQIKTRCETENPHLNMYLLKYRDLIQFVKSFPWIRHLFLEWDEDLFEDLIGADEGDSVEKSIIFDELYNGLKESTPKQKDIFFKSLIDDIHKNDNLCAFVLVCIEVLFDEQHWNFLEMIFKALAEKTTLTHLTIHMQGYTMDYLSLFRHIEVLWIDMRINAEELVEFCKSNPKLRILCITNNEFYGKLSDITLDNNSLQYLENLQFGMKPDVDAAEYAPLAKLPQLKELFIHGTHETGSLSQLFSGLAERKQLTTLILLNAVVNDEETHAISQMKSLTSLICGFIEVKSIGYLSHLSKLQNLVITSENELASTSHEIVKILTATKKKYIQIRFCNVQLSYKLDALEISTESVDIRDFSAFSKVPNLYDLYIETNEYTTGSLQNLLKAFANENLKKLRAKINHYLFGSDRNDISAIAAIKSLETIDCLFEDFSNIDALEQMPQLKELTVKLNDTPKLESVQNGLKQLSMLCPALQFLDLPPELKIDLPATSELVKIKSLKTLKCGFSDDESIKCLDKFTSLKYLEIKSKHNFDNISEVILRIVSSTKTSVNINADSLGNSIRFESHNKELELFVRKKRNASRYAPLGRLQNCNSLKVIGKCKSGSLHPLFQTILVNENLNLKVLHINDISINYEETLLISQIKTLKILICKFSDPRSFKVDLPNTSYKLIAIKEDRIPTQIFDFMKCFDGLVIIKHNKGTIKYNKNEKKLIMENIPYTCDYDFLKEFQNLDVLHILNNSEVALATILANLALNSCLKKLTISTILLGEVLEISKISSLRTLSCGFPKSENLKTLAQLKELQELTITSHQIDSLEGLFKEFASHSLSALQYLDIRCNETTIDELKAIAGIESLRTLKCSFTNTRNESTLLTLPHLTELCITNHKKGSLLNKLRLFGNCPLQKIEIVGGFLNVQDVAALSEFKSLRVLHIEVVTLNWMDLLFPIKELEELKISIIARLTGNSINFPTEFYINFQKLRKLTIRTQRIDFERFKNILKLSALKSLHCELDIKENTNLGRLAQLEELNVTNSVKNTTKLLLQALIEQTPKTLKHFASDYDEESLQDIAKLTNLETLKLETFHFRDASNWFLCIIRECTKLEWIEILQIDDSVIGSDINILQKTLDILKTIRDPILQKPLKLIVPLALYTFSSYLTPSDKRYLNVVYRGTIN